MDTKEFLEWYAQAYSSGKLIGHQYFNYGYWLEGVADMIKTKGKRNKKLAEKLFKASQLLKDAGNIIENMRNKQ